MCPSTKICRGFEECAEIYCGQDSFAQQGGGEYWLARMNN